VHFGAPASSRRTVARDQHAAITTVVTDQRIKEMPVERAESIGASHNLQCGRLDRRRGREAPHEERGPGKQSLNRLVREDS
jgi:hypothetical protein